MKNQQKQQKTEFNGVLNPGPTAAKEKSAPVAWKPAVGEAWVDLINNLQASSGSDTKPLLDLQDCYQGLVNETLRRSNVKDWNDRQELLQSVWLKFWQMVRLPRGKKGAWNATRSRFSSDPVATMLAKIAWSRAIDFHRAGVRSRRKQAAYIEDRICFGTAVAEYAVGAAGRRRKTFLACTNPSEPHKPETTLRRYVTDVAERVPAAVAQLPSRTQMILALRTEGQSVRQIGQALGVSAGEASRRLTDARNQARNQIRETCLAAEATGRSRYSPPAPAIETVRHTGRRSTSAPTTEAPQRSPRRTTLSRRSHARAG